MIDLVDAVPDAVGTVEGFRVWGLRRDHDGWLLQSTAAGFTARMPVWEPRERFSARCLTVRPCAAAVPEPMHGCGIYALSSLEDALDWGRRMAAGRAIVVGEVAGWGRVVETTRGWRAQHAYPQQLLMVIRRRRRDRAVPDGVVDELQGRYL